jgi:hypothetical protein
MLCRQVRRQAGRKTGREADGRQDDKHADRWEAGSMGGKEAGEVGRIQAGYRAAASTRQGKSGGQAGEAGCR